MSKQILKKELIFINIRRNEYRFYNIEVLSVGFNQMQVITTFGKLGNKGRENIIRIHNGDGSFKEAMKLAYKKIFEKKTEGYISLEKLNKAIEVVKTEDFKKKKGRKKGSSNVNKSHLCDLCGKKIEPELYNKINSYARGEGGWDKNKSFLGYQKILCLSCQIEHDIFQKVQ